LAGRHVRAAGELLKSAHPESSCATCGTSGDILSFLQVPNDWAAAADFATGAFTQEALPSICQLRAANDAQRQEQEFEQEEYAEADPATHRYDYTVDGVTFTDETGQ
jgi:hypothetical protein